MKKSKIRSEASSSGAAVTAGERAWSLTVVGGKALAVIANLEVVPVFLTVGRELTAIAIEVWLRRDDSGRERTMNASSGCVNSVWVFIEGGRDIAVEGGWKVSGGGMDQTRWGEVEGMKERRWVSRLLFEKSDPSFSWFLFRGEEKER